MKIEDYTKVEPIKLCHAKPGQVIRLYVEAHAEVSGYTLDPELFIVSVMTPKKSHRAAREGLSIGLYDEERPLFLVSLSSGEARDMPHLSSRVHIVKDVRVVVGRPGSSAQNQLRHPNCRCAVLSMDGPKL